MTREEEDTLFADLGIEMTIPPSGDINADLVLGHDWHPQCTPFLARMLDKFREELNICDWSPSIREDLSAVPKEQMLRPWYSVLSRVMLSFDSFQQYSSFADLVSLLGPSFRQVLLAPLSEVLNLIHCNSPAEGEDPIVMRDIIFTSRLRLEEGDLL